MTGKGLDLVAGPAKSKPRPKMGLEMGLMGLKTAQKNSGFRLLRNQVHHLGTRNLAQGYLITQNLI